MKKIDLSIAIANYDRIRPLVDGTVNIEGVSPVFLFMEPEEIMPLALDAQAFDICEMSMSTYSISLSRGTNKYTGVPVFPCRTFRHSSISVRTDRIKKPSDLIGKRVGIPEYQLTAAVWVRALLEDQYGVKPSDIQWVRGGQHAPGRQEKMKLDIPPNVSIEQAPENSTLSSMLAAGDIDAIVGARQPASLLSGTPNVGYLFPDLVAAASDYFRKTKIFPIMHILAIRNDLVERHPWLPSAVTNAFTLAKNMVLETLGDRTASKVMLPFTADNYFQAQALMGPDIWPYGLEANREVLTTFCRHHHSQGLSTRLLTPEEMFHPSTHKLLMGKD